MLRQTTVQFALYLLAALLVVGSPAAAQEQVEKYPDGKTKAVYALKQDGTKHGPFESFHADGARQAKGMFRDGQLHGAYQSFHANGKPRIKATYLAGKLSGKFIEFDAKGAVVRASEYKDDRLHGAVQEFADGQLVKDEIWVADEMVVPKSAALIAARLQAIGRAPVKTVGEAPKVGAALQAALDNPELQAKREMSLRHLQAYRFLCDLPYEDLVLDRTYIAHTEAACDIMARVGKLTHTPENPGMPEAEYQFALKGTSSSNIYSSPDMVRSISLYMDDSDENNIDRLGHRRWCLNPAMLKTGVAGNHGYSALWAMDQSREEVPDYSFVAFPPRGLLPQKFFKAHYAWSVTVNPKYFGKLDPMTVKPTIHAARFNPKTGVIEKSNEPLALDFSAVELSGFGVPNCVIFRPADLTIAPGASFWVEITGLVDREGEKAKLGYLVSFIDL